MGRPPGFHLSSKIFNEIAIIGASRAPAEACGVILPTPLTRWGSQVVELSNRALKLHEYHMLSSDIAFVLEDWQQDATPEQIRSIMLWHTHPDGLIGPSSGDLRTRVGDVTYLVVALTAEGPIPTYF